MPNSFATVEKDICDNCEVFRKIDTKKLQPYSKDLTKAIDVQYNFTFSKSKVVRQAQIKEYIIFAVALMKVDQLTLANDYANQAYRKYKEDFDTVLKTVEATTKKTFLDEVEQAQFRQEDGDDGPAEKK
jgi:hypothetical protein